MSKGRKFKALRGFRDFPPGELALREHVFAAWRRVSRRYGFEEYDGPPLEDLELYVEKSGEEIVGQLYAFQDKGGRDVALRPEMTPSLARILADRSRALPKPIRWFSVPQLFRYERQQRGRLREHFQWNVDLVGEAGVEGDAEVLAVALDALRDLGLGPDDIRAGVCDRRLHAALFRRLGVPAERLDAAYAVVDKAGRQPRERTEERLRAEVGLPPEDAEKILDLLARPGLETVREEFGGDGGEIDASLAEMDRFLRALDDLGLGDFVAFDLGIVRGLAYYTGIVFEIFDRAGELRAVCGGGRYDRLLELVGGESLPAVGFGMGDVVLSELLKEKELASEYRRSVDYYIVSIGEEQGALGRRVARSLRARGRSVVTPLRELAVRKQFQAAAAEGAREVIVLGPEEAQRGAAIVRDMAGGGEREVPLERLLSGGDLRPAGAAAPEGGAA